LKSTCAEDVRPRILVDADACPVKDEIVGVALRHSVNVIMVSNSWMRIDDHPLVHRHIVDHAHDAADDWIAGTVEAGEVVITADIALAARCLEKNALVVGPDGRRFGDQMIGMAMAMRDLNAHLRDAGMLKPGGRAFAKTDRSRFKSALENIVRQSKRQLQGD
jgi:uncharacterized protein YaiI (UPF0178 family)